MIGLKKPTRSLQRCTKTPVLTHSNRRSKDGTYGKACTVQNVRIKTQAVLKTAMCEGGYDRRVTNPTICLTSARIPACFLLLKNGLVDELEPLVTGEIPVSRRDRALEACWKLVPRVRIPLPPPCSLSCREIRLLCPENRRKSPQFLNFCSQTGPEKVSCLTPRPALYRLSPKGRRAVRFH
jgi:hypothetical protein